jgi:hypothetical protein
MPRTRTVGNSFTLDRNRRPHFYKKGTRVHILGTDAPIDSYTRMPGADFDTRHGNHSFGIAVGHACATAVNGWIAEFGPKPDTEELCLFVTFTSFEIIVEVSDANKWEG